MISTKGHKGSKNKMTAFDWAATMIHPCDGT